MTDLFVSYKREDESRVVRLVQALESEGLSVWWDRSVAGGENWHAQIEAALDAARCVVVVWTRASVAPAGSFVRDEARHGATRGVLVPVKLEKLDPPLGFGEIQAIDLAHWKGSTRDPFFQDLVAAVKAKLEGRPVPPPKGPANRLLRRVTYSGVASVLAFFALAFGLNAFHLQDAACGTPGLQPGASDVCGAIGLGNRPTRRERIAWATRSRGSCEDLRRHISAFPDGVYRSSAAEMLAARLVTQTDIWTPGTRTLTLGEPRGTPSRDRAAAQTAAVDRARERAEQLCKPLGAGTLFRFKSARAVPQQWDCGTEDGGVACGFEGDAVCEVDERHVVEREVCGK